MVRPGGRSRSVTSHELLDRALRLVAEQPGEAALHRRGVGLAPERGPQVLEVLVGLVAERALVPGVGGEAGVDEVGVVVVVELDDHAGRVQAAPQRVLGVGGHQVGEVRRAERRGQSQVHRRRRGARRALDDERADEAEVGDRLVELGVEHRAERDPGARPHVGVPVTGAAAGLLEDGDGHVRPSPARWPPASRRRRGARSPSRRRRAGAGRSGTSRSYIFAALRPRIFFFCSTVIGAYSVMSSGIWKSTNDSTSHFGVQSA